MDLAQQNTVYHRPTFQTSVNDASQREAEDEQQQQQYQQHQQHLQQHQSQSTPFQFNVDGLPAPQANGHSFSTLSSNLFMQQPTVTRSSGGSSKEDNEDVERQYQHDQDLKQQLADAESWQGDWAAVAPSLDCPVSSDIVPMPKSSLEALSSASNLHSLLLSEDKVKMEMSNQELLSSAPRMIDPFSVRHNLPPMPMTAGLMSTRNLEHYANIPFQEGYSIDANHSFSQNDSGHLLKTSAVPAMQCPPRSAPPTMHNYPPSVLTQPRQPPQASIFTFRPEDGTGEIGWALEKTTSPYQATPLLNGKLKFPTRPLHPGVLARCHNEWLDEYPETMPEMTQGMNRMGEGMIPCTKRFPTPQGTFESQHVRTLWQELERRRILEVNDTEHLRRLRLEAIHMIKAETAYRASAGVNGLTQQELFDSIPEPPEEHVNHKARILWEQTKKSATYAVGLLRQAEYCIAQGHLGFMPLNHNRAPQQQQQQQHQQQQSEHNRSGSSTPQRPQMMAAFIPADSPSEAGSQGAPRLRGMTKQQTEQETA